MFSVHHGAPRQPPLQQTGKLRSAQRGCYLRQGRHDIGRNQHNRRPAMATKTDFTPDEWKLLLESVMTSGIAVTAAEPSGLWGTLKESFASAQTMASGKGAPSELIKAMVADLGTSEGRGVARDGLREKLKGSKAADIKARSIEGLRQASALLDAKAPQDAAAVKGWLRQISLNVAEAASEGGFMGFGGVPVSDAEKATLAEIDAALA
jgi:hypothetical protein